MKALSIAASGMVAQQHRTEVVANNLANMNTTGYQRRRTEFNDLLYRHIQRRVSTGSQPSEVVPSGVHPGLTRDVQPAPRILDGYAMAEFL